MAKNCFMQVREYGPNGWSKFLPAILLADRVDTWIPSGADLKAAHSAGICPIAEDGFIELMRAGVVKAGVREANILPSNTPLFLGPGDSQLDRFLREQFENGSELVIAHPKYDSAKIAFEELQRCVDGSHTARYAMARYFAERQLMGEALLPPFVLERADQFGRYPLEKIDDPHVKECMRIIRTITDAREREVLVLCSQIIRLAVEHDHFMQAHRCDVMFGSEGWATVIRSVANGELLETRRSARPIPHTVSQILELVDFLLDENPIKGVDDLLKRREKLEPYREAIWDLGQRQGDVDRYLREQVSELNPLDYAFGTEPLTRRLSGSSFALNLSSVVGTLLDSIAVGPLVSLQLALARAGRAVYLAEQNRLGSESTWLGVLVYDTEKPTREQMRRIAKDLDHHIAKGRRSQVE